MYDDWKIDEPNLWAGGISDPSYVRGTGQNHTGNTSGEYLEDVFTVEKLYNDSMKKEYLERASYPTDLTDEQWAIIAPLFVGMRQ
ncbi:MAG: hypothetical protein IJQ85_10025, partial [Selenomonadaceae bacterium]|nr:hypothetical protein [Selenomonadaceae bacterium]